MIFPLLQVLRRRQKATLSRRSQGTSCHVQLSVILLVLIIVLSRLCTDATTQQQHLMFDLQRNSLTAACQYKVTTTHVTTLASSYTTL
jgi:hypothetical protein